MKKRLKILNPKDFFNFEFKLQMMLFRVRIHFIFALCGFSLLMLSSLMCISKQSKFNYFKMSKSENFSNSYINENVLFTSNEVILKNLTVDDEILTVFKAVESQKLLSILNKANAFLVNINILKSINQFKKNKPFYELHENARNDAFEFGIYSDTYKQEKIHDILKDIKTFCSVDFGYNGDINSDNPLITCIYLSCNGKRAKISVFYKTNKYLWIGKDNILAEKWFGDVDRLMSNFQVQTAIFNSFSLKLPVNIDRFLFDYEHSQYVGCNRSLANKFRKIYEANSNQINQRNGKILSGLAYLTEHLENNLKRYYLSAGTLLGWYRECSFIPHTTDVDIAMQIEDFDARVFNHFLCNDELRLLLSFGSVQHGYELRLTNDFVTFDIFFMYYGNSTKQWNAFYEKKMIYKKWVSYFKLCSTDLLGHKFIVPCEPEDFLNSEYDNWSEPKPKDYRILTIDFENGQVWPHNMLKYFRQKCWFFL